MIDIKEQDIRTFSEGQTHMELGLEGKEIRVALPTGQEMQEVTIRGCGSFRQVIVVLGAGASILLPVSGQTITNDPNTFYDVGSFRVSADGCLWRFTRMEHGWATRQEKPEDFKHTEGISADPTLPVCLKYSVYLGRVLIQPGQTLPQKMSLPPPLVEIGFNPLRFVASSSSLHNFEVLSLTSGEHTLVKGPKFAFQFAFDVQPVFLLPDASISAPIEASFRNNGEEEAFIGSAVHGELRFSSKAAADDFRKKMDVWTKKEERRYMEEAQKLEEKV